MKAHPVVHAGMLQSRGGQKLLASSTSPKLSSMPSRDYPSMPQVKRPLLSPLASTLSKRPLLSPLAATSSKRPLTSPLDCTSSKRRLIDSGMTTDTPSTVASTSPIFEPRASPRNRTPMSRDQMENLSRGLEDNFIFRIWNTFRGLSTDDVIHSIRRGALHPNDTNMLICEAEDREIRVSQLIEVIVACYIRK